MRRRRALLAGLCGAVPFAGCVAVALFGFLSPQIETSQAHIGGMPVPSPMAEGAAAPEPRSSGEAAPTAQEVILAALPDAPPSGPKPAALEAETPRLADPSPLGASEAANLTEA